MTNTAARMTSFPRSSTTVLLANLQEAGHRTVQPRLHPYIFFEATAIPAWKACWNCQGQFVARWIPRTSSGLKISSKDTAASKVYPVFITTDGSVDDVKAYCKKLIDHVGKDGGYILSPAPPPMK